MIEYLDIVDEEGNPTGEVVERTRAHSEGIRHRTAHVWMVRNKDGHVEALLQKRCDTKDSYPGCYDISSAGHIPAGVDYLPSAVREIKEELGIDVSQEELIYCGSRTIEQDAVFNGRPFHDRQFTRVFTTWCDLDEDQFVLQEEEVSEVKWVELDQLIYEVTNDLINHCVYPRELLMVKEAINR